MVFFSFKKSVHTTRNSALDLGPYLLSLIPLTCPVSYLTQWLSEGFWSADAVKIPQGVPTTFFSPSTFSSVAWHALKSISKALYPLQLFLSFFNFFYLQHFCHFQSLFLLNIFYSGKIWQALVICATCSHVSVIFISFGLITIAPHSLLSAHHWSFYVFNPIFYCLPV